MVRPKPFSPIFPGLKQYIGRSGFVSMGNNDFIKLYDRLDIDVLRHVTLQQGGVWHRDGQEILNRLEKEMAHSQAHGLRSRGYASHSTLDQYALKLGCVVRRSMDMGIWVSA